MRTTALLLSAVALAAACASVAATGTLALGPRAALVAFDANLLSDIQETQRAAFVMKVGVAVAP
jgi:imidazolonepropionase-like amidohydrolase